MVMVFNATFNNISVISWRSVLLVFISTGIFYDKLRPQILSVGTTTNATLRLSTYLTVNILTTKDDKMHHVKFVSIEIKYVVFLQERKL